MNLRGLAADSFHTITGRSKLVRSLEASMWADPVARTYAIETKLHRLMMTARSEAAFYRAHPSPSGSSTALEALAAWPIVTRDDLRSHARDLRTGRSGRIHRSSGSTGKPVAFLQDTNYWRHNYADKIRTYRMCGFELGQPAIWLWAAIRGLREHSHPIRARINRIALNISFYNSRVMTDALCRRILDHIA